jgi:hypothetical protein
VLLYELLQFLLFELGEGVDLPGYSAQGVGFEFDGMVPDSWFWEVLRSLFAEDFMVTLVANWYGVLGSILSRGTWPFDSCYENQVLFLSIQCGGTGKEFGSGSVWTPYDNGELGMVEPTLEPVDLWLYGGKPQVSEN